MKTLLGIDIGGTKIAGGVVDAETGAVLRQDRVPTFAAEGGPAVLARAIDLASRLRDAALADGLPSPAAVGVGAGGQIDAETGTVLSATALLPGWAGTGIAVAFEKALSVPCAADNDVNALAAGETRFGAGRGCSNLVYLALGTGVGGGIVSGGRLHRSRTGVSGEIGHLVLIADGLPCTCGGKGCLEQYVSGPALRRQYAALGGPPLPEGIALADLARQDPDSPAGRAIRLCGELLGLGLVSLVNLFGPEQVIIGGGLAGLGDLLLEPARQVVAGRALPAVRATPIRTAGLGADASLIGAASLAIDLSTDRA
ncbi:MAG: ROK family protein [Capsulimonadales bacterium]|nr:ROK family protein [Capsulimonadales bacterium]